MTALGGIGHTLPYLIHNFNVATTVAIVVVLVELATITWVRHRFMDTPPLSAAMQVAFGGALVFATGILIGNVVAVTNRRLIVVCSLIVVFATGAFPMQGQAQTYLGLDRNDYPGDQTWPPCARPSPSPDTG